MYTNGLKDAINLYCSLPLFCVLPRVPELASFLTPSSSLVPFVPWRLQLAFALQTQFHLYVFPTLPLHAFSQEIQFAWPLHLQ